MENKYIEISFEKAIKNNCCCVLEGKNIKKLSIKNNRIKMIKEKIPMCFEKLNKTILEEFGYLGYIDFWSNVKIKKVKYS